MRDAEVVRNEKDAHALWRGGNCVAGSSGGRGAAQGVNEVEDLCLDGDVESGSGFVGDEERGLARDCDGDHDALSHAAGEFMGELISAALWFVDADGVQSAFDMSGSIASVDVFAVEDESFEDLLADGEDGVEA